MSRRPWRPARRPAAGTGARLPSEPRVHRHPGARCFTPRTEGSRAAHKAAACTAPPGGRRPRQRRIRPPGRGNRRRPLGALGRPTGSRARRSRRSRRSRPAAQEEGGRGPCEWAPEPERRTGKHPATLPRAGPPAPPRSAAAGLGPGAALSRPPRRPGRPAGLRGSWRRSESPLRAGGSPAGAALRRRRDGGPFSRPRAGAG